EGRREADCPSKKSCRRVSTENPPQRGRTEEELSIEFLTERDLLLRRETRQVVLTRAHFSGNRKELLLTLSMEVPLRVFEQACFQTDIITLGTGVGDRRRDADKGRRDLKRQVQAILRGRKGLARIPHHEEGVGLDAEIIRVLKRLFHLRDRDLFSDAVENFLVAGLDAVINSPQADVLHRFQHVFVDAIDARIAVPVHRKLALLQLVNKRIGPLIIDRERTILEEKFANVVALEIELQLVDHVLRRT